MTRPDPDDLDTLLRAALDAEASSIAPRDRLAEIRRRTAADVDASISDGTRGWLVALAAAAVVVALTLGAIAPWRRPNPADALGPATASRSTATSWPPISPAPVPTRSARTGSGRQRDHATTLPAYVLAVVTLNGADRWRLTRTFTSVRLPGPETPEALIAAALDYSLGPGSEAAGWPSPWAGVTVTKVRATPELITVTLSGPGRALPGAADDERARIALQLLVWTAQGAYQAGRVPVTFEVAQGSRILLGRYPAAARYDRPDSKRILDDVAPVLIDRPSAAVALDRTLPVPVDGVAAVPGGRLVWWLTPAGGTGRLADGTAVADRDPDRGTPALQRLFAFEIPPLGAGTYELSVGYPSPTDGSPEGVVTRSFTTR